MQLRFGLSLLVAFAAGAAFAQTPKLNIGDPAPPLKVAKWVKGTPIKSLKNGKVHVVEFWATWCGPCRTTIPHLTELAKKYKGKVEVTGVSVFEEQNPKDTAYMNKVSAFVKEMGTKMNYNVAVDDMKGTMGKTWFEAAGQTGIPSAFVVDKTGKIVWIGHPMGGLDDVLAKVVAGKFDVKAAAAQAKKEREAEARQAQAMSGLQKALGSGDHAAIATEVDKLIKANPQMEPQLVGIKFEALLHSDEPAAYAYATKVLNGFGKNQALLLNNMAWLIVGAEFTPPDQAAGVPKLKTPDYALAIRLAERAAELGKDKDAYSLDTLAVAYYKAGQLDRAIATQRKAVAAAKATANMDKATLKEIEDRMELFLSKKGG